MIDFLLLYEDLLLLFRKVCGLLKFSVKLSGFLVCFVGCFFMDGKSNLRVLLNFVEELMYFWSFNCVFGF